MKNFVVLSLIAVSVRDSVIYFGPKCVVIARVTLLITTETQGLETPNELAVF